MDGRPLDVLEAAVDDEVVVRLKGGEALAGTLAGYDQHMNLVLVGAPAAGATEPQDGDEVDGDDGSDDEASTVDNTTVIRGDNVVTIET